jgi:hypothetical protein
MTKFFAINFVALLLLLTAAPATALANDKCNRKVTICVKSMRPSAVPLSQFYPREKNNKNLAMLRSVNGPITWSTLVRPGDTLAVPRSSNPD